MKTKSNELEGQIAFITGGASGIGLAISRRYVNEGAQVVIADLDAAQLLKAKNELGAVCITIETNVTIEPDIEKAVDYAVGHFGRIDIAVNSAGVGDLVSIAEQTEAQWDRVLNTCLKGVFLSMKHEGRQMMAQGDGGVIINLSSLSSQQPALGLSAYCSAKAGVSMITKVGAMEMAPKKIRVCAIGPGLIETPMTTFILETPSFKEEFLKNIPLGRVGTPEDIAGAALFLASRDASWITGHTLFVDGASSSMRYPDLPRLFSGLQ